MSRGKRPIERDDTSVSGEAFKAEVQRWALRVGVRPKEVRIVPMKRKWASCSSSGRLSFSVDLLTASAQTRDRVIVHELLHLRIPNHGRLFRALEMAYLGEGVSVKPFLEEAGAQACPGNGGLPVERLGRGRTEHGSTVGGDGPS